MPNNKTDSTVDSDITVEGEVPTDEVEVEVDSDLDLSDFIEPDSDDDSDTVADEGDEPKSEDEGSDSGLEKLRSALSKERVASKELKSKLRDSEAQVETLTARVSELEASASNNDVRLLVYKSVGHKTAEALLDSISFVKSLEGLKKKSQENVSALTKTALEKNPSLNRDSTKRGSIDARPSSQSPKPKTFGAEITQSLKDMRGL